MNVKLRAFTYLIEDEKKECITQSNLDELLEKEKLNNSFSLKKALLFCSKMAGICYMRENFDTILKEKEENTLRRLNRVLTSGHHSVFDHFYLTFEISDIPKILAMILNNEKNYTTSEKSARYTTLKNLSSTEKELYTKWTDILTKKILEVYPNLYDESKKDPTFDAKKKAMENARYFVSIFTPSTSMGYTVSLRQLNILTYMLTEFLSFKSYEFVDTMLICDNISKYIEDLIDFFKPYEVKDLIPKGKNRRLSIFGEKRYMNIEDSFLYAYQTSFECSYACFAQNQRHRSETCFLYPLQYFKFYVPEILENTNLKNIWLEDAKKVSTTFPQGQIIKCVQTGNIDTFLLKCSERICGAAQLEIMRKQAEIMQKFIKSSPYKDKIIEVTRNGKTAKCEFLNGVCGGACMLGKKQFERVI